MQRVETPFLNRPLVLETGRIARQAHGAIWLQHGNMVILATAVSASKLREGVDFFPLTVDYREKFTAVGKFPGGYIKRESRPTEKEILTARCIDRPMRPLFPKGYFNEVQLILQIESADPAEDPGALALTAASAAVCISDIPFPAPIAAVSVAKIDGTLVVNAPLADLARAELLFTIAGSRTKVVMIEGEAKEATEQEVNEAVLFGHQQLQPLIALQEELIRKAGKPKREYTPILPSPALVKAVEAARPKIIEALDIKGKQERNTRLAEIQKATLEPLQADPAFAAENPMVFGMAYDDLVGSIIRDRIVQSGIRPDGRGLDEIRPITCEVGILPRTHGSALFTRG
ncbi:polyribonucleotide nucleotidyltransferase, partial [bacterium]|nr:polyribonucleotide nucleotidyltransferase [bacterium]